MALKMPFRPPAPKVYTNDPQLVNIFATDELSKEHDLQLEKEFNKQFENSKPKVVVETEIEKLETVLENPNEITPTFDANCEHGL